MSEPMFGWESLARGVIDGGARVLTSYPGAPVTKVVEGALEGSSQVTRVQTEVVMAALEAGSDTA